MLYLDLWVPVKIPIEKIENVNIEQDSCFKIEHLYFTEKNTEKYLFDFVKQVIIIHLKNGKVYKIYTKKAEKIKEEIEKRMIK